jgi:lysozyme
MKTLDAARVSYLRGADFSQFQATIDWIKLAGEKFAFCFIRASHGGQPDTMFASHRAGAKSINLPAGFYHYLNPVVAIDAQVTNFTQIVGSLKPGDLRPVLDVEGADAWAPVAHKDRLGLMTQWLVGVTRAFGVKPMIYLSLNFLKQVIADPSVDLSVLAQYDLWIAEYGLLPGVDPTLPFPWTVWKFWQFSDTTKVAGIDGDVDGDYFNGTQAELNSFAVIPAEVVTTPVPETAIATSEACLKSRSPRTRTPSKKTASKKAPSKKTASKKTASKKAPSKKTASKKAPSKKTASKKAPSKASGSKTPSSKTPSSKTPSSKTPSSKTPSKEASKGSTAKK